MSVQLFLADMLVRFTMKRQFAKNPDVLTLRRLMAGMKPAKVPEKIAVDTMSIGGIATELVSPPSADRSKAVLYIHGGGFVGGAPENYRALTWRLADALRVPIYVIAYRLAPEHPFPAGLEDCVAAYRGLLDRKIEARSILVAGDSAGGNLTLALALKLKQLGLPQPAGLVCMSPVTDLAEPTPSHQSNARADAMFDPRMFATATAAYCPNGDPADPLISPLRGEVSGLPPTLIQCSDAEMLRDDGVKMAEKLKSAGVTASVEVWPKVFHVWQVMADLLPESRRAIDKIVAFARERLAAA